jgi:hypothetical protein
VSGRCERADDELAAGREPVEPFAAQVTELTLDTMSDHGVADGPTDHEADAGVGLVTGQEVHHEGGAAAPPAAARHSSQVGTAREPV